VSSDKKPSHPATGSGGSRTDCAVAPCEKPGLKTALGKDVDEAIEKCPKFAEKLKDLQDKGWSFEYGKKGGGSYCSKDDKKIVLDENQKGNTASVVETMAHESGHAGYAQDPYVPPKGLTKDEYARTNANRGLKDEGEATLSNVELKKCLKDNGGIEIGVAGAQSAEYEKIAKKYPNTTDREKARQEIADIFADKEHPSTDPKKTYREYYEKTYRDAYDKLPEKDKKP